MVIELAERLDAAASELLAGVKRADASSEDLLVVLARTKAVRSKLDAAQALAASSVAGSQSHGDGGAHVLAQSAGMSSRDARSQVKTAEAIDSMPSVLEAVEDGRMSFANAKHLADAHDKTSASAVESDEALLAKAEAMQPEQFAKEAKRWTYRHQADNGDEEHRRRRARRRVRIWNSDDGMVHLHGEFDPITGRQIGNRLKKEARRLHDADKTGARASGGQTRTLQQCMADALENMTRMTAGGKPYADIALVARLDPETEMLMGTTADGDPLPPAVLDKLTCGSSLFGLVLSAKGVPIWKGRNIRKATESQFQALIALYGGCAGCGETDADMIQAHHIRPCSRGGATDLSNLMPLCWGCHDKVHDHNWVVVDAGNGKHTIRPPNGASYGPARMADNTPLFAPADQRGTAGLASAAGTGNGSRAEPNGPRAARAALRKARAARA